MEKVLIILKGIPGSGKTTAAETLFPGATAFAADDYFLDENKEYKFDPQKLGRAHEACVRNVDNSMSAGLTPIVVHNTTTTAREMRPYLDLASAKGYKVFSFVVENYHGGSNVHGVPMAKLEEMAKRLMGSIKLV